MEKKEKMRSGWKVCFQFTLCLLRVLPTTSLYNPMNTGYHQTSTFVAEDESFIFDSYTPSSPESTPPQEFHNEGKNGLLKHVLHRNNQRASADSPDMAIQVVDKSFGIYISNSDSPFVPFKIIKAPTKMIPHVTFNISLIGNPKLFFPMISSFVGEPLNGDETLIEFVMIQRGKRFKVLIYLLPLYTNMDTSRKAVIQSHCLQFIGYDTTNSFNEIRESLKSILAFASRSISTMLKYYILVHDTLQNKNVMAEANLWADENSMSFSLMSHDSNNGFLKIFESSITALHQRRLNKLIKTFDRRSLRSSQINSLKKYITILGEYHINKCVFETMCSHSTTVDYNDNGLPLQIVFEEAQLKTDDKLFYFQTIKTSNGFVFPFKPNIGEDYIRNIVSTVEFVIKIKMKDILSNSISSKLPIIFLCIQEEEAAPIPEVLQILSSNHDIPIISYTAFHKEEQDEALQELLGAAFNKSIIRNSQSVSVTTQKDNIKTHMKMYSSPNILSNPPKKTKLPVLKDIPALIELMKDPDTGIPNIEKREKKSSALYFTGKDALEWILNHYKGEINRFVALQTMQRFTDVSLIRRLTGDKGLRNIFSESPDQVYRLVDDNDFEVINIKSFVLEEILDPHELAESIIYNICEKIPSFIVQKKNDFIFDYESIIGSDFYNELVLSVSKFQMVLLSSMNQDQKTSFWINVYNILSIHAHIYNYKVSRHKRKTIYERTCYYIDGNFFSLDRISSTIFHSKSKKLKSHSKSKLADHLPQLSLQELDWRIHFKLTTMNAYSPTIKVTRSDNLDSQLDLSARTYLNKYLEIKFKQGVVSFILQSILIIAYNIFRYSYPTL